MKNVIVLGGSGYVGTHLAEVWLKQDPKLEICSISRHGRPQKLSSYLENNDQIQWLSEDIFDIDSYITKLPTKVDTIVNLVGTADAKSTELFMKINVEPVKIMIELMDRLSIPKGCFISGVIGMPFKNKPFIASKQKAETLIRESRKNISIIKPSLVYGDKPEVAAMVPFMKLMGKLPGKSNYKPIQVNQLAQEIVEVCNK
ncbi:NAD-dependent epimerase/dehydratase family protein [Paenibacillus sp. GCM10028914]|uniref:NAD-dependent epimerase/dehydratase family protein n=1 Tax=Paenibacillus sp. GCM10028914 TaxID=3273416 RepID=UPI00360D3DF3